MAPRHMAGGYHAAQPVCVSSHAGGGERQIARVLGTLDSYAHMQSYQTHTNTHTHTQIHAQTHTHIHAHTHTHKHARAQSTHMHTPNTRTTDPSTYSPSTHNNTPLMRCSPAAGGAPPCSTTSGPPQSGASLPSHLTLSLPHPAFPTPCCPSCENLISPVARTATNDSLRVSTALSSGAE